MAISQVRARVNGTWHTLTYDSASGSYKTTITAPGATSYNQIGGYYKVAIKLNNVDQGSVTVGANGSFSKAVTLKEGGNTLVITATDAAGKVTSVTRTVTLDTSVPEITSATIAPNPVDAGKTVVISVVIV